MTAEQRVTAAQAGYITHHNERAVRWRIAQGHLPSIAGDDGHMRVSVADLERVPGWHVDLARLDELTRRDPDALATLEERIRALESRVRVLEGRQVTMGPSAVHPHVTYPPSDTDEPVSASFVSSAMPPRRAPVQTVALSSELPPGWVPWRSFAVRHGIPEQTAQKAIDDGRLPARRGRWKVGRVYVLAALDAQGQAALFRLWGGREDFIRCPGCPHTPVLADSAESVS